MTPEMRDRVEGTRSLRGVRNGLIVVAPFWATGLVLFVLAVLR